MMERQSEAGCDRREGRRKGGSEKGVESCNGRCRKWKSHFKH